MKHLTPHHPKPTQLPPGFTLVELLVVISIIVVLAGLAVPTAIGARSRADQVTGLSNVRNIKSALDLFAGDFDGEYPNEATAQEIAEIEADFQPNKKRSSLKSARLEGGETLRASQSVARATTSYADDYYQQLIGNGLSNEELFYARSFKKTFKAQKGNNDGKLTEGENVWGYVKGLQATSAPGLPIVFDSPISLGEQPRFHKDTWDRKIIVARLDGSTKLISIGGSDRKTGVVTARIEGERTNLFSPDALQEGELVPANLTPRQR